MYGALWWVLPGPRPARAMPALLLLPPVVVVGVTWVFPAVAPYVPFTDTTVGGDGAPVGSPADTRSDTPSEEPSP